LASVVWVAAIVAAARDADILLAVCRVRRGANVATFGGTLLVVGASSSLPPTRRTCTPRRIAAEGPARPPRRKP
jgi:hypothetical protein